MASCTTNCLAPIVKILNQEFEIESGFFHTVHSYTNTQRLVDGVADEIADDWDASQHIIVSSTGAAKAIGWIYPHLDGLLTGTAQRVPTPTVSLLEVFPVLKKPPSHSRLEELFRHYASIEPKDGGLKGILGVEEKPWPSGYFKGNPYSCIVALPHLRIIGKQVQVVAWYDNVWGYVARLVDLVNYIVAVNSK
jgi:glyceraldehyde 3-phosphate dehydrogenase